MVAFILNDFYFRQISKNIMIIGDTRTAMHPNITIEAMIGPKDSEDKSA